MMKNLLVILCCCCLCLHGHAQSEWYVSAQSGSNANNGQSAATPFETLDYALDSINGFVQPGDTVLLMGEFSNPSYNPAYSFSGNINDPHIWHAENSVRINKLDGMPGAYITFKAYDASTVLKGDGGNIVRVSNSSYLRFVGFEVAGQVDSIPLSTAQALQFLWDSSGTKVYRVPPGTPDSIVGTMTFPDLGSVPRPSYTDTRGIYFSNVHHIELLDNEVHHMPGGGIRVSNCDYITIKGNEVHNCSRKSYSGTHGLVVTKATSFDTTTGYKINVIGNEVHHNFNEIYSWAPTKTIITPHIDEGKGISLQRNDTTNGDWRFGRFLVANNICYWNGYSGVHSNGGMRMDFVNNSCYFNSYTGTVTNNGAGTGNNIGISTSDGDDIRIVNNISVVDGNLGGFALSSANTIGLVVSDNLIFATPGMVNQDPDVTAVEVNTNVADPQFVDPSMFDFALQGASPARGLANTSFAPMDDFYGNMRDMLPDLGAVEFLPTIGIDPAGSAPLGLQAFPNPGNGHFVVRAQTLLPELQVLDLQGRVLSFPQPVRNNVGNEARLDLTSLAAGVYFLRAGGEQVRLLKF